MVQEERSPWFVFTVRDIGGEGVEVAKLGRLLEDLSSAFYSIARAKIGESAPRPGPRTIAEDRLAGIRLVKVSPGSTVIELAPPPVAAQAHLPVMEEPTADDVALDFYQEFRSIEVGEPAAENRWDIRQRIRTVVADAAEIGSEAEIVYRPISRRAGFPSTPVLRASVRIRELPSEVAPRRSTRRRRVSGHAYMIDVEPGRQRLRVKLPDGHDMTLDLEEELVARVSEALDRVVQVEIEEELDGTATKSRRARSLEILPSSGKGSDHPPRLVAELEREQNLPKGRPDYVALASAIWKTKADVSHFEAHLREIRQADSA